MTYSVLVVALLTLSCAARFSIPRELPSEENQWRAVRGDNSGWAYAGEGTGKAAILWRVKTKIPIISAPVAGDGAIFVPSPNRRVLVYGAETGKRIGRLWVDAMPDNGLALGGGLLAIAGRGEFNRIRVYDYHEGTFLWDRDSERSFAAPILVDSILYFAISTGAIFSLDARTGEKNWRYKIDGAVIDHEPAFRDSLLFLVDSNKRLLALSADSGTVRWSLDLPSPPSGQAVVIPDHVIVSTMSGKILAVLLDGSVRVSIDAPGELGSPVACSGPTIYGVTKKGIVFAGDLGHGGILWQTNLSAPVIAPPVIWGKQIVIVTAEGKIYLLYFSDGAIEHTIDLEEPVTAPPIIYNSNLYIATETGELIAITRNIQSLEHNNE